MSARAVIELSGHIIDSLLLGNVLDTIVDALAADRQAKLLAEQAENR